MFRFELIKHDPTGIPVNDEDVRAVRAVEVQDDVVYFTSVDGKIYAYKLECPQLEGRPGFKGAWVKRRLCVFYENILQN